MAKNINCCFVFCVVFFLYFSDFSKENLMLLDEESEEEKENFFLVNRGDVKEAFTFVPQSCPSNSQGLSDPLQPQTCPHVCLLEIICFPTTKTE